jgi:hypothetical protein
VNSTVSLLDVLGKGPEAVRAFAGSTSLAACDEDGFRLAAILPSHPDWPNAAPEPGGEIAYTLKIAQPGMEAMFCLPVATYSALRISSLVPILTLEIEADGRAVITTIQELSRLLAPWAVKTEADKAAAFASLKGQFERPKPRPPRVAFMSRRLGRIEPDGLDLEWTAQPIPVPLFDGQMIPVSLGAPGLAHAIAPDDADAIDAALDAFLAHGPRDRAAAGIEVLAYCKQTLDAIGADWPEALAMAAISDPAEIWRHVDVRDIHIRKDARHGDPSFYIQILCGCDWEEEHGLQLVYRNGSVLSRVSEADGNVA